DDVGQPDPQSNIRPFILREKSLESPSERYLRQMRRDVQEWNHQFWREQNINFQQCKKEYIAKRDANCKMKESNDEETHLHADELAEFYGQFLNDNYKIHINYNKEWYKKNFYLLALTVYTKLNTVYRKMIPNRA
ncbi:uncharacterized protein TRIADDRAFT_20194, partial [Trichoplax adhaerens]